MENNQELTHWGIKGMKWGRRRYQNKDGSLTPEGKKRYGDGDGDESSESKDSYAEAKAKAIKSGSAADILKFKGDLTEQEMNSVRNRLRWEQDMKDINAKDIESGKTFTEKLDKLTDKVNTGAKAWNTFANIYNAFSKSPIDLPKIDTNITNGNKDKRKSQQKDQEKADEAKKKRQEQEAQADSVRKEREKRKKAEEKAKKAEEKLKSEQEKVNEANEKRKKDKEAKTERWEFTGDDVIDAASKTTSSGKKAADDILDADDYGWREVDETSDSGRNYVAGLLEDSTKYLR